MQFFGEITWSMPAVCFNFLLSRDPETQTSVKFPMASSCQWNTKKKFLLWWCFQMFLMLHIWQGPFFSNKLRFSKNHTRQLKCDRPWNLPIDWLYLKCTYIPDNRYNCPNTYMCKVLHSHNDGTICKIPLVSGTRKQFNYWKETLVC